VSDEELRSLARTARETGAPADVLRHSRAVAALGDPCAVYRALAPYAEHLSVRRDLAALRLPRPSCSVGRRARVRWSREPAHLGDPVDPGDGSLLATPLAFPVTAVREGVGTAIEVLDPWTGAARFSVPLPGGGRHFTVANDVLVVAGERLEAYDLATGDLIWRAPIAARLVARATGGGLLVLEGGRLSLWSWGDVRSEPRDVVWRRAVPCEHRLVIAPGLVVCTGTANFSMIYDVVTGRELRRYTTGSGHYADEHGATAMDLDSTGEIFDAAGGLVRSSPYLPVTDGDARRFLVGVLGEAAFVDRWTGARVRLEGVTRKDFAFGRLARDGAFVRLADGVAAFGNDGRRVWSALAGQAVLGFATLPGLVFAQSDTSLVALEVEP
jgi:hypothetical protein